MSGALDGVVAAVTGASSGIGEATARALAAEGATLALLARRRDRLERLASELGSGTTVHEVDVSDDAAVARAIDDVLAHHGRLDVLVNNAGYGSMTPAAESDFAEWRTMVDVNITGVLATSHAALPHLARAADSADSGRGVADLVTVSSVAGRKVANPSVNVYAATKHAVGAFSEALRQEFGAAHVRVGLVEPGLVRSELTEELGTIDEVGELGVMEAADIADAIVYMVTRPRRVAVNEMLVRPIEQTR